MSGWIECVYDDDGEIINPEWVDAPDDSFWWVDSRNKLHTVCRKDEIWFRPTKIARVAHPAQPQVPEGYALVLADELSRITLDHKRYRWIRDGGWLLIGEDRGNGAEWPPADIVDLSVDKHMSKAMITASQEQSK